MKKTGRHALTVPDGEERHLLSEDLASGKPVSRASAPKKSDFSEYEQGKVSCTNVDLTV